MQRRNGYFICISLWLLLSGTTFLSGQNPSVLNEKTPREVNSTTAEVRAKMVPRTLLLFFETLESAEFTSADLLLMYDSLLIKLHNELTDVLVLEKPGYYQTPGTTDERTALAAKLGADAWLWLGISGSETLLTLEITSRDLLTAQEVLNFKLTKNSLKGLERHFWQEMVQKLKAVYKKKVWQQDQTTHRPVVPQSGTCRLLLKAQPQTTINGLDPAPLTTEETGELVVELQKYRTYTITATSENYYPLTKTIYPTLEELEISLNQKPKARWAGSLYLYNLAFPGIEGTFYISQDFFFVRLAVTAFLWALPSWQESEYIGFPVYDFKLVSGFNLFQVKSIFYSYLALGCTARIIEQEQQLSLPDTGIRTTFYGLSPVLGLVAALAPAFQVYAEYSPLFYVQPSLLLNKLVYDLCSFSAGVRFPF